MNPRLVGTLAVFALGGLSAISTPDPGLRYSVDGPGPLVLRAAPDPAAPQAGALAAGSVGLVLTGRVSGSGEGAFWEILPPGAGDRPAWVAARRLVAGDPDPAPPVLQCSGTEPFWGLKLAAGEARMSRPGAPDGLMKAGPRRMAAGDPRVEVRRLSAPGRGVGQVVVIRRTSGCSDGMSDLTYPYETVVTAPSGEVLSGCCRRAAG